MQNLSYIGPGVWSVGCAFDLTPACIQIRAHQYLVSIKAEIRRYFPTIFSALEHHPKEVRELLYQCWTTLPEDRITFKVIMEKLETLSKKRLARSPSHPVHLFKSAESVF